MAAPFGDAVEAFYEEASSTLLSEQPVDPKPRRYAPEQDWSLIFAHLEGRMMALRNWRWSWWASWADLAAYFLPRRWKYLPNSNTMWRGRPLNDQIIDSTGLQAVRICAAGLYSGLTNPARPWFRLALGLMGEEPDAEAKEWLEDTEQRIYAILHQSNFYTTMAQAFEDVTVFGSAPVIMYEDDEDVLRCYLPCAGEYFLGSSGRLANDTLYREFTYTVEQIVSFFGVENCSADIQRMWNEGGGSLEREFVVCHSIEPNFAIQGKGGKNSRSVNPVPKEFTYREFYWIKGQMGQQPLSKRGFYELPHMVARWSTVANDAYGRSPCMDAIGDNKQIQQETRRKAEFIEKGVRPPMGADPELKNEPASIIPGMITYVNSSGTGKKGFWPLFEPNFGWLSALNLDIKDVQARIKSCLFVDVFMAITMMDGVQPRNELELTQRNLERLQVLGPFIDRFENEFGAPAIHRVMSIAERRQILRPRPQSLQGIPLKIEYDSIMKLAQRSAESVSIREVLQVGGNLSAGAKAAGLPDPLRVINLDNTLRELADMNNMPQTCLFSVDEVKANDQAAQAGKAQAEVLPTTLAGVKAAKALSETSVGGGSLLNSLLTGNVQPQ